MACEEVVLTDAECAYLLEQHDAGIDIGLSFPVAGVAATKQISVKRPRSRITPTLGAAVHSKQLTMANRSILGKSYSLSLALGERAKTYLDTAPPIATKLTTWRSCNQYTKLALAAAPLYHMAKQRDWELKAFTMILSQDLHDRLEAGDSSVLEYIKDEFKRRTSATVGKVEFLFAFERAPEGLACEGSRRRWHIHGLIIGPKGFCSQGRDNPLRKALRVLRGDADADLMFTTPGEKKNTLALSGAQRWTVYACKNSLTVRIDPATAEMYELAPGKETYISRQLRREAERWHEGMRRGATATELVKSAQPGLYGSTAAKTSDCSFRPAKD